MAFGRINRFVFTFFCCCFFFIDLHNFCRLFNVELDSKKEPKNLLLCSGFESSK